jgi:hypothetical protein
LVALTISAACLPKVQTESPLTATYENVSVTTAELRIQVLELTRQVSRLIETAADSIRNETDEPDVRRHALEWKAYSIPSVHEAGLQPDPLVALADIWALGEQMARYFRDGAGRDRLGPFQLTAITTSERIVQAARRLAQGTSYTGDVPRGDSIIQEWADQHPLDNHIYARESIVTYWAEFARGGTAGIAEVVGGLELSVGEVTDRLALHNEYLVKQLRWSLELMADGMLERRDIDSVLTTVMTALDKVEALADSAPELLHSELGRVLATIREERLAVLADVDRQRMATLSDLMTERDTILQALTAERTAAIAELDSVLVQSVLLLSEDLVDRLFWRLVQLVAVLLLAAGVAGVFVMVWRRRRAT